MNRVFDVYDDHGSLLQRQGLDRDLPEWVKEASYPGDVPDDLFALVLPRPISLRKYARDSRANTLLSMLYFRNTSSQLGPDLEKQAARRLVEACDWYGLRAPADLLKKAGIIDEANASLSDPAAWGMPAAPTGSLVDATNRQLLKALGQEEPDPNEEYKKADAENAALVPLEDALSSAGELKSLRGAPVVGGVRVVAYDPELAVRGQGRPGEAHLPLHHRFPLASGLLSAAAGSRLASKVLASRSDIPSVGGAMIGYGLYSQLRRRAMERAANRLVEEARKEADLNGTDLLPYSHQPKAAIQKKLDQATGLQAVRTDGDKVAWWKRAQVAPETTPRTDTESPVRKVVKGDQTTLATAPLGDPAAGKNLTNCETAGPEKVASAVKYLRQKQASVFFADPDRQRYPINSFDDVVTANSYFEKYATEFDPVTRRVMATNIYRRSEVLRVPVSKKVASEAMRKLASAESIRAHLFARATFYGRQSEGGRMFEALMNKAASLHPQVLMETVAQLDHRYGGNLHWGSRIPAPQDILFPKTAADENNPVDYSYDFGTWKISGTDLVRLARRSGLVDSRFDKEFAESFRQDPTGFFDHLPRPEKEVLARMAHDLDSPGSNA